MEITTDSLTDTKLETSLINLKNSQIMLELIIKTNKELDEFYTKLFSTWE